MYWTQYLLSLIVIALLTACSTTKQLDLDYEITSSHAINSTNQNQTQPVVVYLYELSSSTLFKQSDFFSLTENPSKQLGDSLINHHEIEVQAATQLSSCIKISKDSHFIGVVAGFRDLSHSTWRRLLVIPEKKLSNTVSLEINLSSNTLSATIT